MKQCLAIYGPLNGEKGAFYGPVLEVLDFKNKNF